MDRSHRLQMYTLTIRCLFSRITAAKIYGYTRNGHFYSFASGMSIGEPAMATTQIGYKPRTKTAEVYQSGQASWSPQCTKIYRDKQRTPVSDFVHGGEEVCPLMCKMSHCFLYCVE